MQENQDGVSLLQSLSVVGTLADSTTPSSTGEVECQQPAQESVQAHYSQLLKIDPSV